MDLFALPICAASMPLAPSTNLCTSVPVAAVLFPTSIPTFKQAREVLFEASGWAFDVLDAVVVVSCLGSMSIFPGAKCSARA